MSLRLQTGLDRLLADPSLRAPLAKRRVALLGHPASVTANLTHALDALAALPDIDLCAAFGPQHGMRGDKQNTQKINITHKYQINLTKKLLRNHKLKHTHQHTL